MTLISIKSKMQATTQFFIRLFLLTGFGFSSPFQNFMPDIWTSKSLVPTSQACQLRRYTETGWLSQPAFLWAAGIRTLPRNGRWTIRPSSPGSSTFSPRWALQHLSLDYLIRIRILGSDLRTQCYGFSSVLRIRDVYPGSEFFHPGSRTKIFRIRIKKF